MRLALETIVDTLRHTVAGYPGGWRKYARGFEGKRTPPFVTPDNPDDRRSLIPPHGLREYWYPTIPAKGVGRTKPVGLKMLNTNIVLFKDQNGEVQALWDYCPHRGVFLSFGQSFWKGFLTCAYHGATFNGDGECVEFLTEGPDSKMVGSLKAKKYPTVTLKGIVFVWMGDGEPVPPEEDIPPEFFEPETLVQSAYRYWDCNWMVALENTGDAHNMFMVHRNSFRMLRTRLGGRPRTPIGYRVRIVNNKSVQRVNEGSARSGGAESNGNTPEAFYAVNGKVPYQLYHPRVKGRWPKHRVRLLWSWFFEWWDRSKRRHTRFTNPPDWEGQRLPGMVRNNHRTHMYTRWCVPVDKDLTRAVYFYSSRPRNWLGRLYDRATFPFLNWMIHFNFSDQDYDAMRTAQYQYPEYLSSTDNCVIALRRLVTEHARGVERTIEVAKQTTAEKLVYEADRALGVTPDEGIVAPSGG